MRPIEARVCGSGGDEPGAAPLDGCTLENRASSPYSFVGRSPYIQARPSRRNTVVDVAQLTQPVQRWFTRHRAHGEPAASAWAPDGVRIRRRKDNQMAACTRLLGLVSAENGYPLPRPASRREWLTGADLLDAWIAEQAGRIQGHVAITRVDGDPATALRWREVTGRPASELTDVSRFFVRSSARGQGIGTALLETAVAESRARGLVPVAKMVSTSRRGVPLFDRAGWRMVAMYPCGKRGEDLETYLYVAPSAQARPGR
jgi:GNAT superfamily N-acetyltransferase